MLTFSFMAVVVVLARVLFAGASLAVGKVTLAFGPIDALVIAATLGPTLGAYVARRNKIGMNPAHDMPPTEVK